MFIFLYLHLRFRFDPSKEAESRDNVGVSCGLLLGSIMYYARINATISHFRNVENRNICDKIAGQFYLMREEYIAQRHVWCKQYCWDSIPQHGAVLDSRKGLRKNRTNRYSRRFKTHRGGSSSIATIRQRLVNVCLLSQSWLFFTEIFTDLIFFNMQSKKLGRQITDVGAWIHIHRGTNPEDITSLNTEEATTCLVSAIQCLLLSSNMIKLNR